MANEFKHASAGGELARAEYESITGHVFDGQATGDIMYASSATQLTRLGIGATDTILSVQGGIPTWRTPANILTDLSGQAGAAFAWNSQNLTGLGSLQIDNNSNIGWKDSGGTVRSAIRLDGSNHLFVQNDAAGNLRFQTDTNAGVGNTTDRLVISGNVATAVATWSNITHTGVVLSGSLDANGQNITNVLGITLTGNISDAVDNSSITIRGGTDIYSGGILLYGKNHGSAPSYIQLQTCDTAKTSAITRLQISGAIDTAVATWANVTHTGIVLSGTLDANSQSIDNVNVLTIDGYIIGGADAASIFAMNTNDYYLRFMARDTDTGSVEIGRLQGAPDPYFGFGSAGAALKIYYSNKIELGVALTLNSQAFDAGAGSAQVNTTGATSGIVVKSIRDGASGAVLDLILDSASPAQNDYVSIQAKFDNDAGTPEVITYARQVFYQDVVTDGAEAGKLFWYLMNGGAENQAMTLSGAGLLTLDHSLKCNQSQDLASTADEVSIGGYEIGAGNRVLCIAQETAVAAEVDETKFSHKMQVRINGATYYMMLTQT